MQKGLRIISQAASIGILSAFSQVYLPGWSVSRCNAFSGNIFIRSGHPVSLPPLSFSFSKDAEDPNESLTTLKMTSYPISSTGSIDRIHNSTASKNQSSLPPSTALSALMLEVISSLEDSDTMSNLSGQTLDGACQILRQFIDSPTSNMESSDTSEVMKNLRDSDVINGSAGEKGLEDVNDRLKIMSSYASIAAERFCQVAQASDSDRNKANRKNKKRTWEALQTAAGMLQNDGNADKTTSLKTAANATALPIESNALAICMVFGALSFLEQYQSEHGLQNSGSPKAGASALSSTISRNKLLRQGGRPIASLMLQRYLDHAFRNENNCFDLNILNHLAKSFQLTEDCTKTHVVASIVRNTIQVIDSGDQREDLVKQSISGAFALACQLRPWSILSPVELIDAATIYDFYHSAEEICRSAHKAAKDAGGSGGNRINGNEEGINHQYSASKQERNAISAVEKLIDIALESRMYRRADAMATSMYNLGGRSRYVEARYFHACDTIAKVVSKRQFPIVDRQVERVDKAIAKVESCSDDDKKYDGDNDQIDANEEIPPQTYSNSLLRSPSVEIREYAIQKFQEAGEIAAAHRLASIYGIDYVYDEEAALKAAAMRKEKYLQYEDVLSGEVPPLITGPDDLISGFDHLLREEINKSSSTSKLHEKHIGFDAEWDEETQGAALLQLASVQTVLLIDILALSATEDGVNALRQTVGKLLDNSEWTLIGFACRQDLSRLRASPCVQEQHWMHTTKAAVDVQPMIGVAEPSLRTTGLSRACERFLGKPLDKSEQCSLWSSRPLTERQRSYASLDAWVCVGIYQKLLCMDNES